MLVAIRSVSIGTTRKLCHSSCSRGEYASHEGDLDYFSYDLAGYRTIPMVHSVPMVRLVPTENNVIPMVLLVNMDLIKGT